MMTPNMGNTLPEGRLWAADTGCYSPSGSSAYSWDSYQAWLRRWQSERGRCLFATAPDVVADAAATLARSAPVLPRLRQLGYPAALVAQDGLEHLAVPWESFDVLFLGGSTGWKLSEAARLLVRDAKQRGKWVHAGRVNSYARLRLMDDWGCDSADGTFVAFGPNVNIPRVKGWLRRIKEQPSLFRWGSSPGASFRHMGCTFMDDMLKLRQSKKARFGPELRHPGPEPLTGHLSVPRSAATVKIILPPAYTHPLSVRIMTGAVQIGRC